MGCECNTGRNVLEENLNEILEDTRINSLPTAEYIKIIKKAIKSNKNLNDNKIFQSEILDYILKPNYLFIQISYLKNTLINLDEDAIKCYIIFSLLFLCKIDTLEDLKRSFSEIFYIIKDKIQGIEDDSHINDFDFFFKMIIFYVKLNSKYLLDGYKFSLTEVRRDQKEMIDDMNNIYSDETIILFTENIFKFYHKHNFKINRFFDENFYDLNSSSIRENLRRFFTKNESIYKYNIKRDVQKTA